MTSRRKLLTFVLIFAFALTLVGMFASAGPRDAARGPYQSALASVGVGTAEAAGHCANSACEFASPGFFCDGAAGTKCVLKNGCTTVTCR